MVCIMLINHLQYSCPSDQPHAYTYSLMYQYVPIMKYDNCSWDCTNQCNGSQVCLDGGGRGRRYCENSFTFSTPLTSSSSKGHSTMWKSSYKSRIYRWVACTDCCQTLPQMGKACRSTRYTAAVSQFLYTPNYTWHTSCNPSRHQNIRMESGVAFGIHAIKMNVSCSTTGSCG